MKVGSLVYISKYGLKHYEGNGRNPPDQIGTVIRLDTPCKVQWLDWTNTYAEGTLTEIDAKEFIEPIKPGKVGVNFLNELRNQESK